MWPSAHCEPPHPTPRAGRIGATYLERGKKNRDATEESRPQALDRSRKKVVMMTLKGHMLDVLLAAAAGLALAITLSVDDAYAMDVPPPTPAQMQVVAP
jgi:hypothetical protein